MSPTRRLPPDFSHSAAFPLFAFDAATGRGWVLHFEPQDYRRASFLDQRALDHRKVSGWELSIAEIEAALAPPEPGLPLHWIFHIGHCGSSLVSKFLDMLTGVLGLREPLPLLSLAHGVADPATQRWQGPVLRLLNRGFGDTQAVVVKPTSAVTTIAGRLLAQAPGRACLLWIDLRSWLATMLRDEGLRDDTLAGEPLRLAEFGPEGLPPASGDGARLARLWLAEQLRWRRLVADPALAGRLIDLDFAAVLADPAGQTARLAVHYGLTVPEDWAARIADSGLLQRYAKDPRQAFDADARERELAAAAQAHAAQIAQGLDWAGAALETLDAQALRPRLGLRG
ncbi:MULTISPECIES: hypothetical protein [unclassified Lysobacter]|uniref:hypothetical protein n=1 Tax=unclassified Lysobacter TaxID=2635362 RepID=UPI000B0F910B|nr:MULTISPECIES: hypothetical protein [unclassified Lysobacter]